jgi:hypothetical protein
MSRIDEAINKFVGYGNPYFIVIGPNAKYECVGKNVKYNDIDDAAEHLKMWLDTVDFPDRKDIYKVYCFEELPANKLGGKTKDIVTGGDHDSIITFCAYVAKERAELTTDQQDARLQWKLAQLEKERLLNERLERIETLLLKKEVEESEEDEEDIAEQMQPNNIMGALMSNPQLQNAIATGVVSLLGNFLKPDGQPKAVAGVPGTEDDARIFAAVETLKKHDPELPMHLEKLANMAETNTAQFLGLLKFL